MTAPSLTLTAAGITRTIRAAGIAATSRTVAPGAAVRVTVTGYQFDGRPESVEAAARSAANTLIQVGYDVARTGAVVTVTLPEPTEDAELAEAPGLVPGVYLSGPGGWKDAVTGSPAARLDALPTDDEDDVPTWDEQPQACFDGVCEHDHEDDVPTVDEETGDYFDADGCLLGNVHDGETEPGAPLAPLPAELVTQAALYATATPPAESVDVPTGPTRRQLRAAARRDRTARRAKAQGKAPRTALPRRAIADALTRRDVVTVRLPE